MKLLLFHDIANASLSSAMLIGNAVPLFFFFLSVMPGPLLLQVMGSFHLCGCAPSCYLQIKLLIIFINKYHS